MAGGGGGGFGFSGPTGLSASFPVGQGNRSVLLIGAGHLQPRLAHLWWIGPRDGATARAGIFLHAPPGFRSQVRSAPARPILTASGARVVVTTQETIPACGGLLRLRGQVSDAAWRSALRRGWSAQRFTPFPHTDFDAPAPPWRPVARPVVTRSALGRSARPWLPVEGRAAFDTDTVPNRSLWHLIRPARPLLPPRPAHRPRGGRTALDLAAPVPYPTRRPVACRSQRPGPVHVYLPWAGHTAADQTAMGPGGSPSSNVFPDARPYTMTVRFSFSAVLLRRAYLPRRWQPFDGLLPQNHTDRVIGFTLRPRPPLPPRWATVLWGQRTPLDLIAVAVRGISLGTTLRLPVAGRCPRRACLPTKGQPDPVKYGQLALRIPAISAPVPMRMPRAATISRAGRLAMDELMVRPRPPLLTAFRRPATLPAAPARLRRVLTAPGEDDHFARPLRVPGRRSFWTYNRPWWGRTLGAVAGGSGGKPNANAPQAWVAPTRPTTWVAGRGNRLVKGTQESRLYTFDLSQRLAPGERIATAMVTATPAGLTLGSPLIAGGVVQVRLSGGAALTTYTLNVQATTTYDNPVEAVEKLAVYDPKGLSLPKRVAENLLVDVDFSSMLAAGENLLTGTIPAVLGITINNVVVNAPARVQAQYGGGAQATAYTVTATATTDMGNTLQASGVLSVYDP